MRFSYPKPDGGVAICSAASKADLECVLGPLTDEAYRAHVLKRSLPEGITEADITWLADDWTPPDRTFRDAWVCKGAAVSIDMAKARDIQRARLRAERLPFLQNLDVEALRAVEVSDSAKLAEIAAKKQKLRDAPDHPAIAAAKTPDELKAVTLAKVATG
jgi:hypothetical protein